MLSFFLSFSNFSEKQFEQILFFYLFYRNRRSVRKALYRTKSEASKDFPIPKRKKEAVWRCLTYKCNIFYKNVFENILKPKQRPWVQIPGTAFFNFLYKQKLLDFLIKFKGEIFVQKTRYFFWFTHTLKHLKLLAERNPKSKVHHTHGLPWSWNPEREKKAKA